jgi:HD-GYP domain-containing protein (c-di-GMP phosphodiesterase class II)/DNA-binding CsgD family transcriptional regulator
MARSGRIRSGYSAANCEVASAIARRVGLGDGVEAGLAQIFEQWDGRGFPHGMAGEEIAIPSRCAQLAGTVALFDRLGGQEAARAAVRGRRGHTLDPGLVDAYLRVADDVHAELAVVDPLQAVRAAEPGARLMADQARLDAVCRAFGDAVDLKSVWFHGHSAGVAALAAGAAGSLGMTEAAVADARRAGHLQDLGRVAVPTGIWERDRPLTSGEWEQVRLHAYHSERILARCPPLASLAPLAGMHHERLDGSGYHRQAARPGIPMTARILAAADCLQALLEPRPHRPALDVGPARDTLRAEAAAGRLDPQAVTAVLDVASGGGAAERAARGGRTPHPSGLTARQIDVLRLVASGLSNPEIGRRLVVSRRTAEHHVQDIYARIGVSSRAAAALYAMEHDLLW